MTKDEILEIARQAGLFCNELHCAPPMITWTGNENNLLEFAKLVAEKEREACAELAENRWMGNAICTKEKLYEMVKTNIARDIRARGQHD
jgi:hypothetical protein